MSCTATQARLRQKLRVHALRDASDDLRRDREVVITACLNHGVGALVHCSDEALKAELRGLSKSQLRELLRRANDPLPAPRVWNAPPDTDTVPAMPACSTKARGDERVRYCLVCFDRGRLCPACVAARGDGDENASPGMDSRPGGDAVLSKSQKMRQRRKAGVREGHDEGTVRCPVRCPSDGGDAR